MRLLLLCCMMLTTFLANAQTAIIDATFALDNDQIYFFKGNKAVLFSNLSNKVLKIQSISEAIPGVSFNKIDAAINYGNGKLYLFSGKEYTRVEISSMRADNGYPLNTAEHWAGVNFASIDAAMTWSNGKTYFFSGNQYVRYDLKATAVDDGYPKSTNNSTWPGVNFNRIDAACGMPNGKTFFFSGDQYVRFDNDADKADAGYPKNISAWAGLKEALSGNAPNPVAEDGINFFNGTWAEAKAEAKKTGKLIFVDAYAAWCGPCKWMAANSFPDKNVGAFFNKNFINVKMDMEKGEGKGLASSFGIRAYPTLLFIDGNGKTVNKSEGALDAASLLTLGQKVSSNGNPNPSPNPSADEKGIEFFHGTWDEAKAEAKRSGKLIFVDAYAAWCGPCKWMAANSFPNPSVGAFFNKNFINVKMDMEKGEGKGLMGTFGVRAYPTLLFIDGNGKIVNKSEGALDADSLLKLGKKVAN